MAEELSAGGIRVVPTALGDAAGAAGAVSASVRSGVGDLLAGSGWQAAGDAGCADALSRAARLLEQTLDAAADGVSDLGRALAVARDAYRTVDTVAVPGASR